MKLLPHYFKWIGIGMLLLSLIFGFEDFCRGLFDGLIGEEAKDFVPILPEYFSQISDYVILMGLLVYILAKNKTEDEFAQKLRYESAFIVLVLTIIALFVVYIINPDVRMSPAYILLLQMLGYLLIRYIKRGVILGA
jgi:hypothetical protein